MQKYATMEFNEDSDGIAAPTAIIWNDDRRWKIRTVLHTCAAFGHKFEGIRYTDIIGCAAKYLYRDGQRWCVGCSP